MAENWTNSEISQPPSVLLLSFMAKITSDARMLPGTMSQLQLLANRILHFLNKNEME